ncbi:hypothetical protein RB595_000223 [Gaeumannomyces hyphopodioides]
METSEGLKRSYILGFYARMRSIGNLLPQLQAAQGLERVVPVLVVTQKGKMALDDLGRRRPPSIAVRNQLVSMATLTLEELTRRAPDVSFVHDFSGLARSGITQDMRGRLRRAAQRRHGRAHAPALRPRRRERRAPRLLNRQRHVPPDGALGSGAYSIGSKNGNGSRSIDDLLARLWKEGVGRRVDYWDPRNSRVSSGSGVSTGQPSDRGRTRLD